MTAGAPCTVCASPNLVLIDADLSNPPLSGFTRLARIHGLQKDAVRRHKLNGHVIPPKPNLAAPPTPTPSSTQTSTPTLVSKTAVEVLEQMLIQLDSTDTSDFSAREINLHNETKRRTAVDLAKYQVAADREGPAQRELRALEEMVIAGDEALESFPEARAAVALAIKAWKDNRASVQEDT